MTMFTKTCLILSAVIGVIGAGLFLAGMIIGPDWSVLKDKGMQYFGWAEKVNVLADGKGFDSDGLETIYAKLDTEAKQEYEFSKEEVSSLSIETEEKNAIYLEFKTDANASSIKVKSYNSADVVEYDREDRELSIEREGKNHQGEKDPIEIILPQDMQFESVTVEMNGGGQLVIDKLNAASLDLEVGAGVLQVSDELRAQECEIEVGAGEVSVAKLDAKVSDISCGTGTVDMKMAGKREDYSAEAEVGMGTVQIGDNVLSSGFGNEFLDKNDTGKELSIDCGMGDVQITFES